MRILTATSLAAVMVAATAFGQSAKPSPYQGVSHPPDDAIVTDDLTPTPPASTDSTDATRNRHAVGEPAHRSHGGASDLPAGP